MTPFDNTTTSRGFLNNGLINVVARGTIQKKKRGQKSTLYSLSSDRLTPKLLSSSLRLCLIGQPSVHRPSYPTAAPLLQELNVQTDRPHKQVDVLQTLGCHVLRKRLGQSDGIHDTILDGKDQTRLLVRACPDANGGKQLPDIHVFARGDSAGEHVGKAGFEKVEELGVSHIPTNGNVSNVYKFSKPSG